MPVFAICLPNFIGGVGMKAKHLLVLAAVPFALFSGCGDDAAPQGSEPAPVAGTTEEKPKKKKALVFGLDGARPDALEKANTPNFDALRADGVYSGEAQATDTTWSGSGWSTLLHGVWRDKHGVKDNTFSGALYAAYPDLFTRLEQNDPLRATMRITSWDKMYGTMVSGADTSLLTAGDEETTKKAIARLSDPVLDTDAMFVYFLDPDKTGHAFGFHPAVPQYVAAIEAVDARIGQILAALKSRPTYASEDWLILAVTDHGGTYSGHGSDRPEDRTVFFLASGPSVVGKGGGIYPSPDQTDLVPTVLAHLGVTTDPAWKLDGRVIGFAPSATPPAVAYDGNLLRDGDAELGPAFGDALPNAMTKQWIDVGKATAVRYGSAGWPTDASPGPANRGKNFFAGGASELSSVVQRVDVSTLAADIDGGQVQFTLSAYLGGCLGEADSAEVTARFLKGVKRAAVAAPNNKVYFFSGSQYFRCDAATIVVDGGYPKSIATYWPGLDGFAGGAADFDAALEGSNGKLYFFKGDQYLRYDWNAQKADAGFPKPIATSWPGLGLFKGGAKDLEAAVNWGNGKSYFFKGDEYIRYDMVADKADAGYPRRISDSVWGELGAWPIGIDAAVSWPSDANRAYFFKQGRYIRWKKDTDERYNSSYPKAIDATTWGGLTAWHSDATTVTIGPVTSADRTNVTGLLERKVTGSVPPGTKQVEVEVLFRRASGAENDGTADNLSLVLKKP